MLIKKSPKEKSKLSNQFLLFQKKIYYLLSLKLRVTESNRAFMERYDYHSNIYFIIDNCYIIKHVNVSGALFVNIDKKLFPNQLFLNLISPNSQACFQKTIQTLLNTKSKQTCEIEILQPGCAHKITQVECVLLQNKYIRLSLQEISSTLQLEMQIFDLKKSLNLGSHGFQYTNDAIAALDDLFYITLANQEFFDFFSKIFAINMHVGMNLSTALSGFPELHAKILNATQHGAQNHKTSIIIENINNKTESYYCYEMIIAPVCNESALRNKIIFYIRNLTEFKQEEIKQHQQQSDIQFASRISIIREVSAAFAHEINQPLTAISAYSQGGLFSLKNIVKQDKKYESILSIMEQINLHSELAGNITSHMKNFMSDVDFHSEETDMNQLILETISILHFELESVDNPLLEDLHPATCSWDPEGLPNTPNHFAKIDLTEFHEQIVGHKNLENTLNYQRTLGNFRLKISLNLMKNLPIVTTNKIYIMQIILNLIRNSIEALRNAQTTVPELGIRTQIDQGYITVNIIDNGPGIEPELQDKIFHTYFTTKSKGTGMGLGICRSLIETLGGKLILQKTAKGASFMFTLPM